ncbi:putative glycosyltransferase [Pseudooceanicola batsensis HTCC2597]|uniref:Putative glycosyltransferase n=1 Tax=Pseudooceanicola batsensis (strain ATCC BAA-863 / DSM 15984 / KCTC 12145 / HTCC2597) TaxID=252305 RepID=A3TWD4_PSEBH|nr:glycosyltransferase family 2 protein [Pseudooceanicola batsensis]EAQ03930.1 putative glycosyltransferase [Pseudooceanicola batsensis HTCC2597]
MDDPTVSVVVVSRDRGPSLELTLVGLARQLHDNYEIVVVADAAGLDAVRRQKLGREIKTVPFADPNISLARNLGTAVAAGEVVAFIDDDAVPEPTWLRHLTAPFSEPDVAAAGGFVIGRNGISFQWKAHSVDHTGQARPLDVDPARATALTPPPGRAVKTEGTNMAFRRSVLAQLGGFDPAYRFYLDDTDLNMRLARARHVTAVVPMAQVHHSFAPSSRRHASRAPRDLFEIGASLSVFLRRHCPEDAREKAVTDFVAGRDRALISHMVAGRLEPRDLRRLRARLAAGIEAGRSRTLYPLPGLPHSSEPFLPFRTRATGQSITLAGRPLSRRRLRAQAAARAAGGATVSLFILSPTALFHRVRMTRDGVWEQTGGIWGRARRDEPLVRATSFRRRLAQEIARIAALRQHKTPSN